MATQHNRSVQEGDGSSIISPFAQMTSSIRPAQQQRRALWPLWIVSGVLGLAIFGNTAYFSFKYLNNPYRMLEPFSVDKYMTDFQPLTGNRFEADLRVEADLGWKEKVGRLMVFTAPKDNRPILVMIPPKLAGIYFTKGQIYQTSLEVCEGGLIYADSCDKE